MINAPEFEKKQIIFTMLMDGEKISFSNDNIVIKKKDGSIKHQSTCYRLFMLCVIGRISITSVVLEKSKKFGFVVVLMNHSLKVNEVLGCRMKGNTLLRRKQYEYNNESLAKHIIYNKVINSRHILEKERKKDDRLKEIIASLKEYENRIAMYSGDLPGLLGLEGLAARSFFKGYYGMCEWEGRRPRIKADYVNSTLDIGYTILFNFIEALLDIYGFDVYCGVLHREFYMRKSLVCDLMEPFRVLIDQQVRKSINLSQCQKEDFVNVNGRFLLKWEKNAKYIGFLMQPILAYKMEMFYYIQGYYRSFMKNKSADEFPIFEMR